jgi:hypothetical protein
MTLNWILGWWNLIYLAPFLIALTYLGVYVMTGITFGDADVSADHDLGADHDVSADHDIGADQDLGIDHDLDADHGIDTEQNLSWEPSPEVQAEAHAALGDDVHHDSHGQTSGEKVPTFSAFSLLQLIGFGKVPLSLMVMILLICWGISGFATNQMLHKTMSDGDKVGLMSLPIAAAISLVATALITRALHKVMPQDESTAKTLPQLVGQHGTAILPINDTFGLARVLDGSGVGIQVPCRVAPGQETISANRAVVLMRFDRSERVFYVTTPDRLETFRAAPSHA